MLNSEMQIRAYLADIDLELVDTPVSRGAPEGNAPRFPPVALLQAKLRGLDRKGRPDPVSPPEVIDDLVLLRVRSRQEASREFTVVFSRSRGAIVGEQA